MDHEGPDDPFQTDDADGPLDFDRIRTSPIDDVRRRLSVSVPGAIGGVLLIGALAFGSNLGPRYEPDRVADAGGAGTAVADTEPTDAPDGEPVADEPTTGPDETKPDAEGSPDTPDAEEPTEAPDAEPTEKPEPDATPKATERPEPKPTAKPTEKPEPAPTEKPVLSLALAIKEGAIFIDWSACEVDGADVYKVVRSTDSTVKWPAGDGDQLIAATEVGGSTKAWDEHAAPGKKTWYRVFCVRKTEDGYKVLAASAAKSIVAPADEPDPMPKPTPAPEPADLAIEAGIDGGNVVVNWEACGGETFSHYRVLRKAGEDAKVIAEIEHAATTTYVDDGLEPGTYHYAVQCKGHVGDDWFLLGASGWATVTVE